MDNKTYLDKVLHNIEGEKAHQGNLFRPGIFQLAKALKKEFNAQCTKEPKLKRFEQLVSVVQEQLLAIADNDFTRVAATFDDGIEHEITCRPATPFDGKFNGIGSVIERMHQNFAEVREQDPRLIALRLFPKKVELDLFESGLIEASQARYEVNLQQVFYINKNRISRFCMRASAAGMQQREYTN